MMVRTAFGSMFVTLLLASCAGKQGPVKHAETSQAPRLAENKASPDDDIAVEGIMGSLPEYMISESMNRQLPAFLKCFEARMSDFGFISGRLEMAFRVRTSGRVRWVYPKESTLGDRETERCILSAAKTTKFPPPYGGEVEFTFPIELDPADSSRIASTWDAERVMPVIDEHRSALLEQCGLKKRDFHLTVYIGKGGQVLTAGGAVDDAESQKDLDCITEAIRTIPMPDPGRKPSKVAFGFGQ